MDESGTTGQGRRLAPGWQGLIAAVSSALLYAASFPPFNLPEAAYVFAVPLLLWALFGSPARREWLLLLGCGWLAWVVLISWLRNCTLVLDIPLAWLLGWFITAALALVLGLFWAGWCWAALRATRLVRDGPLYLRLAALLALPALWVVMEWLRGVIFTGLPWLTLSVSQWQRPLLLQVASVTGGAGVSYVLMIFNFGLALYLHNLWRNRKAGWLKRLSPEFYTALAVLMGAIAFGLHSSGAGKKGSIPGPRLGFVQPDVEVMQKWDGARLAQNLELLKDLSTYAVYLGADLVIWPESPTPLPVLGNDSMREWVEGLSQELQRPLLIGNIARVEGGSAEETRWYNTVFYVDPQRGVDSTHYYAKRRLVPFGEYVPLARLLPFIDKLVPIDASFSTGDSAQPLPAGAAGRVGNLICYEDIFPGLARANTLAGADWHFVATNNVWFGEEGGAWQHAAHSVLRAVETRRPVVRCGNAGWTGWIDEFGHVRHVMLDDKGSIYFQGVEAVDFRRNRWWAGRLSPYVQHGDWFVALCGFVVVLAGVWIGHRQYRSKGKICVLNIQHRL